MSLHLISFKTCPFVQRAVITLKHKKIDFDITYIDLAEPTRLVSRAFTAEKSPGIEGRRRSPVRIGGYQRVS